MAGAQPGVAQEFDPAGFQDWLADMRQRARAEGISPDVVDSALHDGLTPRQDIIESDRNQPEDTRTFAAYLADVVNDWRVRVGRERLAANADLLREVGNAYGVQPRFIVALWGIETAYGEVDPGYPVIQSLATLAYDQRRREYFTAQLLAALRILEAGHISQDAMMGSWAGAMGQNQFMPTSYLDYAVDYDGDGRANIWSSKADIFASAANYLAQSGWRKDETWGRRVQLPADFDPALIGRDTVKDLQRWQALGVRRHDGRDLPPANLSASVIAPDGVDGPAFVGYNNYRTLLTWNRSDYFAISVGVLSDRIAGRSASG